jgi:hypothetical protein
MKNSEKLSHIRTLLGPSKLNQAERPGESIALELQNEVVQSHEERLAALEGKSAPKAPAAAPAKRTKKRENGK